MNTKTKHSKYYFSFNQLQVGTRFRVLGYDDLFKKINKDKGICLGVNRCFRASTAPFLAKKHEVINIKEDIICGVL